MDKRALLIAFHFPPFGMSTGVLRTLKNIKYLPDHGWTPFVLTVDPRAYRVRADPPADVPAGAKVERAFCLDAARHFALRGRYAGLLAIPDRWVSWWVDGVFSGMRLIHRYRPQVIWSTFPIATAHLIALTLHRWTSIPWVVDMRDPMTEDNYPEDPRQWKVMRWLEERCVKRASVVVVTTPGAGRLYAARYPDAREKLRVIENGYDEDDFTNMRVGVHRNVGNAAPVVLVHSGILYPEERDPREFYAALQQLKAQDAIGSASLRVVLRGSAYDEYHRQQIEQCGVQDIVELRPHVRYEEALQELWGADGLLLFQGANCNHQIPAKIYEYLRVQRPIFALTNDAGDTAELLRRIGIDTITPLDDRASICRDLSAFLGRLRAGTAPVVTEAFLARLTRRARTAELAALLDEVSAAKA